MRHRIRRICAQNFSELDETILRVYIGAKGELGCLGVVDVKLNIAFRTQAASLAGATFGFVDPE